MAVSANRPFRLDRGSIRVHPPPLLWLLLMAGVPGTGHAAEAGAAGADAVESAPAAAAVAAAAPAMATAAAASAAAAVAEYRLKATFVYNFVLFTEWPDDMGSTLTLCIYGPDPFGAALDALRGKEVGSRSIRVVRKGIGEPLDACQILFIAAPAIDAVPQLLERLRGSQILTIADSPGAAGLGVALNLAVAADRVTFEVNLPAARSAGLNLSSNLLRLAALVIQ
jgi:hypothetical protein